MTPELVRDEITLGWIVAIRLDLLKVRVKENVLILSGHIAGVQGIHSRIMQKFIPTHCKQVLRLERFDKKVAVYSYRFN
jgi:hypothetical protein